MTGKHGFRLWAAPGNGSYSTEDDTGLLYGSVIEGIANRHAHQRKISRRAFAGFEIGAPPGWRQGREGHSGQHFIVSQNVLAADISLRASKKLFERERALSRRTSQGHPSP